MSNNNVEANQLLRSAYQIAKRKGVDTNWSTLQLSIERELLKQNNAKNSNSISIESATRTARIYKA